MSRLLLASCLCLVAGAAFSAEPQVDGDGPDKECPRVTAKAAVAAHASGATASGARAPATTPAVRVRNGGGGNATKVVAPRWHHLLPGMFR
jgi:hypothetical protein